MKTRIHAYTLTFFILLFAVIAASAQDSIPVVDSIPPVVDSASQLPRAGKEGLAGEVAGNVNSGSTLDTYLFEDWHKTPFVFSWKHNPYFNTVDRRLPVDTLINGNFPDYPFQKKDVGATFLGTSGGAALTHDYFKREDNEGLWFFSPFTDYMLTRNNVPFYNSKGPFTILTYHTSGQKKISEDDLTALFSQNITPEWNVGLYYQRYGTRGVYENQYTDNRVFTFFTSYAGKRYTAHAGYIYNGILSEENGGITREFYVRDTVMEAEVISVNLPAKPDGKARALNKLRSNTFFLTQAYGLPIDLFRRSDTLKTGDRTMVYLGHSFEYVRQYRTYWDEAMNDPSITYYTNYYLNPNESRDSTFKSSLDNRIFIRLQPWASNAIISTIDGGVGVDFSTYHGFSPGAYLTGLSSSSYTDMYLYARVSGVLSRYFRWSGFGSYSISGYRQNDMLIDANAQLSLYPFSRQLNLTGRFLLQNSEPDYFQQSYHSNHFIWNNSFSKTTESRIEVALSLPDYALEVGLRQSVVSNYVYMDGDAMPQQESDAVSITSFYLQKNFKAGILRSDNRILFQLTSHDNVIPLPPVSLNSKLYIESPLVKNVLTGQLGLDVYYHTRYYVQGYNPAVGMFYNQSIRKVGDYPMADVFANFKWKRATIFVKLSHADQGMFNKDYFSAYLYPRNKRMIRFGLSWHFYT